MGTTYSIKVVGGSDTGRRTGALDEAIRRELGRLDALLSTWDPESELSRFNRSTASEPIAVSPETFELFRWSVDLERLTAGALDVTMAPLVEAWGFGPAGHRDHRPAAAEIARLRESTGVRLLELDAAAQTVRKLEPALRCDFSALAAGYAADRIASLIADFGVADFLIDMGGELRARGRNDAGDLWQIAIERPQSGGRFIERMVAIGDLAISTSGDYRNYYELDGERVAHILDPRTGGPIHHRLASVTVIDELAVRADALSTALMVLGPDEGPALAERIGVAALFIVRRDAGGFTGRTTSGFDAVTNRDRSPARERRMAGLILLSILVVAVAMVGMALGGIFSNRCLRGSCGGRTVPGPGGELLGCDTCPLRDSARRDAAVEGADRPGPADA